MPDLRTEQELNDRMWARVAPLLPPTPPHPRGGRPFSSDRACFDGIVYLARNGLRWRSMPKCFPSGVTCWRRHRAWAAAGVWPEVWRLILGELRAAGRLDVSELALDASLVEAKKGATPSATRRPARA